ncbi:PEP-CTERM sorting domain-containing protein [Thiobacillus sp.]
MNFKLNALAAAALLVAAGSANAELIGAGSGNGEMFLVVNDAVAGYSFVGDLGIAMDSFNGAASQSFNLNGFSQWGSFMTAIGGTLNNANFAVLAADSTGSTAGSDRMLVSTSSFVSEADIEFTKSNNFGNATNSMLAWQTSLNNSTDVVGGDMDTVANGSAYSVKGSTTYFDTAIGEKIKNNLAYSVYTDANEVANFGLQVTGGSSSTLSPTIYTEYAGDFTVNGTTLDYAVAAVPEAETYAMMLAGLGLVGFMVSRRRNVA